MLIGQIPDDHKKSLANARLNDEAKNVHQKNGRAQKDASESSED